MSLAWPIFGLPSLVPDQPTLPEYNLHTKLTFTLVIFSLMMVAGCQSPDSSSEDRAKTLPPIPDSAQNVQPLAIGDKAPSATLHRPNGQRVDLADLLAVKPSVLIFYRGGWCPYCNAHLGQISTAEPELLAMYLSSP